MELNNLRRANRIYPGRKFLIPMYTARTRICRVARSKASYRPSVVKSGKFITHWVRRGESLWSISVRYNVTVRQIFRWNKLRNSKIYLGKKLRIRPGKKEA